MNKKKANTIALGCIIFLMIIILAISAGFRYTGAKALPMIVAGCVLILSIVEIILSNRDNTDSSLAPESPAAETGEGQLGKYLFTGSCLVAFLVGIYLLGFNIAIPLFVASYLKWQGRRWLPTIIMATMVTFIIYGLFNYLLGVESYQGLIMKEFFDR